MSSVTLMGQIPPTSDKMPQLVNKVTVFMDPQGSLLRQFKLSVMLRNIDMYIYILVMNVSTGRIAAFFRTKHS